MDIENCLEFIYRECRRLRAGAAKHDEIRAAYQALKASLEELQAFKVREELKLRANQAAAEKRGPAPNVVNVSIPPQR